MPEKPVIVWFRQDLRLQDNPALVQAAQTGTILPVYILDHENAGRYAMGGASQWWLHHTLAALEKNLKGKLVFFSGKAEQVLTALASAVNAQAVYWNRCYEPWRQQRDEIIKTQLKATGINAVSFNASLLWEPWEVLKKDGTPYRVFTPFYKNGCLKAPPPRKPLQTPAQLALYSLSEKHSKSNAKWPVPLNLAQLNLLPRGYRWDKTLEDAWQAQHSAQETDALMLDEARAHTQLKTFLDGDIKDYPEQRDFPAKATVSKLSPHLHFGSLSPNQIWYAVQRRKCADAVESYCRQLVWREFSYHLLFANPNMPEHCLQSKYDNFPWRKDKKALARWQKGQTGIPIVDAGMRELWQTGLMHNRIRMVVGSFLVKNLLLDWRLGQAWFWDCLVDADLANNSAGWQWVAGCGADAAPYFRVFNPVTQAQKFDPTGQYIRKYVPELTNLPDKYLPHPWTAPSSVLKAAGVTLGKNYPHPIVDLKSSRIRALEALSSITK